MMDEDRIDPERTKATIQRSLEKAKSGRVRGASDIVMRMKEAACLPNTGCMSPRMCVCDVMEDAAEEIERLRVRVVELNGFIETIEEQATALEEDNRKLRVEAGYD